MPYREYKPEKLYYSIGEVSEILGEKPSLVRFWTDYFSRQVKPRRNAKGNRMYTPEDVETLKTIHHLVKEQKMTLEGAAERMKTNPQGLDLTVDVIDRLKSIRETLVRISDALPV